MEPSVIFYGVDRLCDSWHHFHRTPLPPHYLLTWKSKPHFRHFVPISKTISSWLGITHNRIYKRCTSIELHISNKIFIHFHYVYFQRSELAHCASAGYNSNNRWFSRSGESIQGKMFYIYKFLGGECIPEGFRYVPG